MKRSVLLFSFIVFFLSGCSTMEMRKISVEPTIETQNVKKSSMKAGLLLNKQFTSYTYAFETGHQIFLMSKVKGEIEVGKNLSHALYGLISSKFDNIAIAHDTSEMRDVDIYFVPRIKSFTYSPPYTGMSSHRATLEIETEIFSSSGKRLDCFIIRQDGSSSMFNQFKMQTNYDMARNTVNEAIDKTLNEFFKKLNEFY